MLPGPPIPPNPKERPSFSIPPWLFSCAHLGCNKVLWEKHKEQITTEILLLPLPEGRLRGKTLLWILAEKASRGSSEEFNFVWQKFQHRFMPCDLRLSSERGESVLLLLAKGAFSGNYGCCRLMEELLAYIPYIFSEHDLHKVPNDELSIADLMQQAQDSSFYQFIYPLIQARNNLFKTCHPFQDIREIKCPDAKEKDRLNQLAKTAFDAGYRNAFFELGNHFLKLGMFHEACGAFQQVPANGEQYLTGNWGHAHLMVRSSGLRQTQVAARKAQLSDALWFALRMNDDDEDKAQLIHEIAVEYLSFEVSKEQQESLAKLNFLPQEFIATLREDAPLDCCFLMFAALFQQAYSASLSQDFSQFRLSNRNRF